MASPQAPPPSAGALPNLSPRPSAAAPFSSAPFHQDVPPQQVLSPTSPTFIPPGACSPPPDPLPAEIPPLSRCQDRLAPQVHPSGGAPGASPPPVPAFPSPHPLPLSQRPLTGAAGSSAAPSPWRCRQPPRPAHCSILPRDLPEPAPQTLPHFRFPPPPEAARSARAGRAARTGPGPRGAEPESRGPRGAAAELGASSSGSSPSATPSRCGPVLPGHWDSGREPVSALAWPSFLALRY